MAKANQNAKGGAKAPQGFLLGTNSKNEGQISEEFLRKRRRLEEQRQAPKVKHKTHRTNY